MLPVIVIGAAVVGMVALLLGQKKPSPGPVGTVDTTPPAPPPPAPSAPSTTTGDWGLWYAKGYAVGKANAEMDSKIGMGDAHRSDYLGEPLGGIYNQAAWRAGYRNGYAAYYVAPSGTESTGEVGGSTSAGG